jgi:predicted RNA-binding protein with EMAP domain
MIYIPVSVGELIDKLSILQVKKNKISNEEKLILVNKEFELLYNLSSVYLDSNEIENLYHQLCEVNEKLWDVEDRLRVIETEKKFEDEFIDYARKVYFTNDERFRLKNEINQLTDSEIREVKEYVKYQ